MTEGNIQALEMAQQSIKQMSEQMTAMYNNLQAAEKENDDPNKEKGQRHQRGKKPVHQSGPQKPMHPMTQLWKRYKQLARHF